MRARREALLQELRNRGTARIDTLATELGVSTMTVHRDLDWLVGTGAAQKRRGLAVAVPRLLAEQDVRHRLGLMVAEKQAIARRAVTEFAPGSTVFLDDSTSCLQLVPLLGSVAPLTVVTNFLTLARGAAAEPGVGVVLLGGRFDPGFDSCLGAETADAVRQVHADVAVLATPALREAAAYHPRADSAVVKRAMIASADRTLLLADSSKAGRTSAHLFAGPDDLGLLVTDDGCPESELSALRQAGVPVAVARTEPTA